jgi:membrane-bound lytic murein transglycosylase D
VGFALRVPKDTAAVAEELLAAVDPKELFAAQRADLEHRVRRGDTLSKIASEYRVSLAALMRVNDMSNRTVIRVGQVIRLPLDGSAAPPTLVARAEPPAPQPLPSAPAPAAPSEGVYVVRSGDSVDRIARRLGVDATALVAANDLRNKNVIQVGQRLVVPQAAAPVEAAVAAAEPPADVVVAAINAPAEPVPLPPAASPAPASPASEPVAADLTAALAEAVMPNGEPVPEDPSEDEPAEVNALASEQDVLAADPSDYTVSAANQITVQSLETLGHYADWLEIPTQRLRDLNSLSFRETVALGRTLALDFGKVDVVTFEQRRRAYHQQLQSEFFAAYRIDEIDAHVIKPGESLWVLAARTYNVPVWLLRQYNPDLNFDRIQPGAVVKFPRLKAIASEAATATTPETLADNVP